MFEGTWGKKTQVTIKRAIKSCQISSFRKHARASGGWEFLNSAIRKWTDFFFFLGKHTRVYTFVQMSIVIPFERVLLDTLFLRESSWILYSQGEILLLLWIFLHSPLGFSFEWCLLHLLGPPLGVNLISEKHFASKIVCAYNGKILITWGALKWCTLK